MIEIKKNKTIKLKTSSLKKVITFTAFTFLVSLAYSQKMNKINYKYGDTIQLHINKVTPIDDSLSQLVYFSHKRPYVGGPTKATAEVIMFTKKDSIGEINLSVHGVQGKSEAEDGLSNDDRFPAVVWENYKFQLVERFNYGESIKMTIHKNTKIDKEVEDLLRLGRDAVIELALNKIRDASNKEASTDNFSKIKVTTNGKDIRVSFSNAIQFFSESIDFYYYADVYLIRGSVSYGGSNGIIEEDNVLFYKETKETKEIKEKINFVFNAINKSDEVGTIGNPSDYRGNISINEYLNYYDIIVSGHSTDSFYKIQKTTGKVYDGRHKHMDLSYKHHSPFIEYKEIDWKYYSKL